MGAGAVKSQKDNLLSCGNDSCETGSVTPSPTVCLYNSCSQISPTSGIFRYVRIVIILNIQKVFSLAIYARQMCNSKDCVNGSWSESCMTGTQRGLTGVEPGWNGKESSKNKTGLVTTYQLHAKH